MPQHTPHTIPVQSPTWLSPNAIRAAIAVTTGVRGLHDDAAATRRRLVDAVQTHEGTRAVNAALGETPLSTLLLSTITTHALR